MGEDVLLLEYILHSPAESMSSDEKARNREKTEKHKSRKRRGVQISLGTAVWVSIAFVVTAFVVAGICAAIQSSFDEPEVFSEDVIKEADAFMARLNKKDKMLYQNYITKDDLYLCVRRFFKLLEAVQANSPEAEAARVFLGRLPAVNDPEPPTAAGRLAKIMHEILVCGKHDAPFYREVVPFLAEHALNTPSTLDLLKPNQIKDMSQSNSPGTSAAANK